MFDSKNILIFVIFAAVLAMLGYMLVQMIQPDPFAGTIVAHTKLENDKAATKIVRMIKHTPKCGKLDISRDDLLKYFRSQECFMLKTEIQTREKPTHAEILSHGNAFISDLSVKLKMCMLPEKKNELVNRIESGTHLKEFLDEIDRSKVESGKLERISRMLKCGS